MLIPVILSGGAGTRLAGVAQRVSETVHAHGRR